MNYSFKFIVINFIIISIAFSTSALSDNLNLEDNKEIYRIEFFGNKVIKDDRISDIIKTKVDSKYDPNQIKEDIKNLYKTEYFYKIDVVTKLLNDKLLVIYRFEENPILADLRISGNDKITDKEILDVIPIQKGKLTSKDNLEITLAIVEQFYLLKGFNKIKVEEKITPIGEGVIQYSLKITEGDRGFVKGIVIKGTSSENSKKNIKNT